MIADPGYLPDRSISPDSSESMALARRARRIDAFAQKLRREMPGCTLLTDKEDVAPYECDGLAAYRQLPLGVVLAESEAQVQGASGFVRTMAFR